MADEDNPQCTRLDAACSSDRYSEPEQAPQDVVYGYDWADLVWLSAARGCRESKQSEAIHHSSQACLQATCSNRLPTPMSPGTMYRVQMLSNFLSAHSLGPNDTIGLNSYLSTLPSVDLSMPLLQCTIDALCYAESPDSRAQMESRRCYASALALLQREVAQPPKFIERRRPVLLSMLMLCLYELSARRADSGWATHVYGAQMYLKACGPSLLVAPTDQLLFHNLRLCAVCLGIRDRKTVPLASPEWMQVARRFSTKNWKGFLFDVAITVPGLAEEADRVVDDDDMVEDLCNRISLAKLDLDTWVEQKSSEENRYTVVHIDTMKQFTKLSSDATFLAVFRFPLLETLRLYGLWWICSALLDVAMLKMFDTSRSPVLDVMGRQWSRQDIESQLYVYATSLCRCIPFCLEEAPDFTKWYLCLAAEFLRHCNSAHKELAWCTRLYRSLERLSMKRAFSSGANPVIRIPRELNKVDPVFLICAVAWDNSIP